MFKLLLTATYLFIAFAPLSAQNIRTYEAEWKKVQNLMQQRNLPKTALEEVKKIYAMAMRDKQDAQIIKSLIYMGRLQQENRIDNIKTSIAETEKEISKHKEPAASILKSLVASLYWQYFQNNRWRLYNRTNTVNFQKEDLATWTIDDFHRKISSLYLESINNRKLLQQTSLAPFDAIIIKGNVRHLRPTLFDLLTHTALDYFESSERDIRKAATSFQINESKAFAPAPEFVKLNFKNIDSVSLQYKALQLYQELIAFHLNDKNPAALIDADIQRLQFVHQQATLQNKEELFINALEKITTKYAMEPAAAHAKFLIAAHYNELASRYQPHGDTSNQYGKVIAKKILTEVVRDSAVKSEGWVNSYNLLTEIEKEEFSFELEKVSVPEKPFRALVRFRNVDALHFRLIAATDALKSSMQQMHESKYWDALRSAPSIRSWQQALPKTTDLQQHSVEIKIEALPNGEYYLIASKDASFGKNTGSIGAQLFYVSNISYIAQGRSFFVLHRETGQPLSNAAVEVYTQEYNYNTSRYTKRKQGEYKTDKNGFFTVGTGSERDRGFSLNIKYNKDRLFLQDIIYNYHYEGDIVNQPINGRTFFFTDRSLYRPGQTVYFKGLVVTNKNEKNDVAANFSTTIFLRNANHELVDSLKMTTNSFGSFNGTFSLPQNVLNGHFTITDKESHYQTSFSVEEYKRPKFFVSFDKIKGTYKAGDTINLTGSAKAYAGNTIDNAKVVYRVVRQARFIYPWNHWRIWPPQGEPMEIAHGTTTTNKDGSFTIQFVAHPDKKLDRRLDPVFDYKIHVDVTDIGGETRTGDNIVSAGYKSLLLKVTVPERISKDSLRSLSIRTENMNGEFQTAGVRVSFYSLVPEPRLVRKRYWQQPDQYLITKEEFLSNFPTDEYRNESEYRNWERGAMVYSKTDTTNSSAAFTINNSNMQPGFYSIEIETKDKEGAVIKDTRFIEVFDNNSNQPAAPIYLWAKGSQPIEPGERTAIQIGSSTKIYLVKQVDKSKRNNSRYISQRDKHDFEFSEINQEKKSFTFNATEIDRGGYGVTFFFVRDNRFYQFQDVVRVPWTNKELNIEYATFRDKTLPGSEEKWKVKINGYKNEKVAAEMLASMYDASLDQFKPHQWNKPMIWLTYGRPVQWQGMQNFSAVQSQIKYSGKERYRTFEKRYDRFMFDNLHRDGYGGDMMMRREMVTAAAPELQEIVVVEDAFKIAEAVTKEEMISKDQTSTESITNKPDPSQLDVRRNFNETAFFFPELLTDKNGNIEFSFTTPEALTRWKLQTFAHTKDLAFGFAQKEIITQKELMVQPNMPRFLRQGDQVTLSSKIANLSEHALTGTATLQLFDATTNAPVDAAFGNTTATRSFTAINGESTVVTFPIKVPVDFTGVLTWRIVASAASKTPDINSWSDGEEMTIPVLSNKLLVTETMPLPMRGSGTKSFAFDKLLKGSNSTTLQHHALTVEYTSNPAWYAVQALPYLMEQSIESAEQIWNRYYANSLAVKIISSAPRIKQIFEQWKTLDTSALLSNLQKNQELTNALLEETPWVLQAKTEEQQKKNIALLFDLVRMSNEIQNAFRKLKDFQSSNGGFVWVKGAPDDRYMTQYIITGIGHLKQLNAINADQQDEMNAILKAAIPYLDRKIAEDYAHLIKSKASLVHYTPGYLQVQYLYMRSFFPEVSIGSVYKTAHNFYQARAHRTWMKQNKYMQGMIALALHRNKDLQTPADIIKSLKETAINSEEMGMYWQDQRFGYSWNWWHAPIETQALLVEAFTEISADTKAVDDMRTWLIKHKQTNNWRTSKATAEAVYAFLLQGTEWLSDEPVVQIELGSTIVKSTDRKTEAGTGYFKHTFDKEAVKPAMGNIKITVNPANNQGTLNSTSWGAVYWQYFEDMDKITNASTPLQLNKKLFVQTNSDRGPVLTPVTTNSLLQVGDKITVRVEVTVDRDMEYVHMKDMRASAFEPVNVLSGYKWQGGLGYYETTKDVSTSFFFPSLRRGTYVFEYSLFVTHTGSYSNGITTIQSMYAPEFSAHSEGVRVRVGE